MLLWPSMVISWTRPSNWSKCLKSLLESVCIGYRFLIGNKISDLISYTKSLTPGLRTVKNSIAVWIDLFSEEYNQLLHGNLWREKKAVISIRWKKIKIRRYFKKYRIMFNQRFLSQKFILTGNFDNCKLISVRSLIPSWDIVCVNSRISSQVKYPSTIYAN